MSERLVEKIDRLATEAGINEITPSIRQFALLVRSELVAGWPNRELLGLTENKGTSVNSINDWAEFMLWAEKNMKDLEKKLLHKDYDMEQLRFHAACIKESVDKSVQWAENAKQK